MIKHTSPAAQWFIPRNAHRHLADRGPAPGRPQAEPIAPRVYCNPLLPAGWREPAEPALRIPRPSRCNGAPHSGAAPA